MNIFFKNHLSFTFDTITWNTRGTCITHVTSETRSALKQSKSNEIFIRNDIRRTYILSSKTWWTLKTWRAKWTGPALFNKLFRRKKQRFILFKFYSQQHQEGQVDLDHPVVQEQFHRNHLIHLVHPKHHHHPNFKI